MFRRHFLKLLGLAPAAVLPALPVILPEPDAPPDEVLHYPASEIEEGQRQACKRWLDSIGYGHKLCFDVEIWLRRGRPYKAVLHCWAQNAQGHAYLNATQHGAEVEIPTEIDVTTEPERVP